jgi:hypothetical protein
MIDVALCIILILSLPIWMKAGRIHDKGLRHHSERILGMLVGMILFVFMFFKLVSDISVPISLAFMLVLLYMTMEAKGITSFSGTLVDDTSENAISERASQLGGSAFILCVLIQSDPMLHNALIMPTAYIALGFLILTTVPSRTGKRLRSSGFHDGLQKASLTVSAGLLVVVVSIAISLYTKHT